MINEKKIVSILYKMNVIGAHYNSFTKVSPGMGSVNLRTLQQSFYGFMAPNLSIPFWSN